jgi:hypothetical protein
LKLFNVGVGAMAEQKPKLESQEGLKHRVVKWGFAFAVAGIPESQEGLKHH